MSTESIEFLGLCGVLVVWLIVVVIASIKKQEVIKMQTLIAIILTSFQILFVVCILYLAQKNLKINIEIEKEIEKIEKKFGFKN